MPTKPRGRKKTTTSIRAPAKAPTRRARREKDKPSFIEEARRKQILDVSLELIADRGYDRTSLTDIADAVGVSKGVISYHFDGKSDLGKQVLRHWMRQYNRYVTERMSRHTSPRTQLLELPAAAIDFSIERPHETQIYADTVGCFGTTEERHAFLAWAEDGMRKYILDIIRRARAAGEIGNVAEGPLADLIQGMTDGITGLYNNNPKAVDVKACKAMIRQALVAIIGNGR